MPSSSQDTAVSQQPVSTTQDARTFLGTTVDTGDEPQNAVGRGSIRLLRVVTSRWFVLLALLVLWELAAALGLYQAALAPSPSRVVLFMATQLDVHSLILDVLGSLRRVATGFTVAMIGAVALATLHLWVRSIRPPVDMLVELIRPIPPIAWIPIAIIWLGIGDPPAYFIVFLGAFFPIFANLLAGLTSVDPHLRMVARSFGAGRFKIFWSVELPSIVPFFLAGARTGLGVAWMCVVTAEMIGAQSGIGYRLQLSRVTLQTENIIIGMMLIGIIGYALTRGLLALEAYLTPWKAQ